MYSIILKIGWCVSRRVTIFALSDMKYSAYYVFTKRKLEYKINFINFHYFVNKCYQGYQYLRVECGRTSWNRTTRSWLSSSQIYNICWPWWNSYMYIDEPLTVRLKLEKNIKNYKSRKIYLKGFCKHNQRIDLLGYILQQFVQDSIWGFFCRMHLGWNDVELKVEGRSYPLYIIAYNLREFWPDNNSWS